MRGEFDRPIHGQSKAMFWPLKDDSGNLLCRHSVRRLHVVHPHQRSNDQAEFSIAWKNREKVFNGVET